MVPNKKYELEKPEHILDVLKEYHEQTLEDCRIIGNQKYSVLISLSIALGSFIYVLSQIYVAIRENTYPNTCEVTFNTLSSNAYNLLSFYGNVVAILSGSNNTIHFSQISAIINAIIISLILFIIVFYMAFHGFFFLMFHLPLVDDFAVQIEELQRDILFKEMKDKDLFNWKEIGDNESKEFKDYIKQKLVRKNKFFWENISTVNTDSNENEIQIYITKKLIQKTGKKVGTLRMDTDKETATLTIYDVELDQFNVKKIKEDYILYESELKYRFRKLMPHTNVLKTSYILNLKMMTLTFLLFAVGSVSILL